MDGEPMDRDDGGSMRDSETVLKFLAQVEQDLADGGLRPLERYTAAFPEDADLVRREYERLVASAEPPDPGASSRVIGGRYEVLDSLGRGGFAEVLLARDASLGRKVAIKCLTGARSYGAEWRARLVREAHAANRIRDPGVCPIFDVGFKSDGSPFLVMPWIPGRSLDRHLAASASHGEGPVQLGDAVGFEDRWRRLLVVVESLARSLHAAHRVGVVHRDVKPANVIVRPDGAPVLIDFGLASLDQDGSRPALSGALGTPAYAAPELLAGDPSAAAVTPAIDIWSLGVVLFEGLMLRRPFAARRGVSLEKAILEGDAVPLDPVFGRDLRAVLECALAGSPGRRYPSMEAFAEDLYRVRTGEPVSVRPRGPIVRAARWLWRRRAQTALAAAGLVIAASLVWIGTARTAQARERDAVDGIASALAANTIADVDRLRTRGVSVRERIQPLHALIASVRELRRVLPQRPAIDRVLARALLEAGALEVQLGGHDRARELIGEAEGLLRVLIDGEEGTDEDRASLARGLILAGDAAHHLSDHGEALRLYRAAQDLDVSLLEGRPDDATRMSNVGFGWVRLGHMECELGSAESAVVVVGRGVSSLRRAAELEPDASSRMWDVAKAQVELASCMLAAGRDDDDLRPVVAECEATCRRWVEAQPLDAEAWSYLRGISFHQSRLLGDPSTRLELCREMVEFAEMVFDLEPHAPLVRMSLANMLRVQAEHLAQAGRLDVAEAAVRRALDLLENTRPRSEQVDNERLACALDYAVLAADQGRKDDARCRHDAAVEMAHARYLEDAGAVEHLVRALLEPGLVTLETARQARSLLAEHRRSGSMAPDTVAGFSAAIAAVLR